MRTVVERSQGFSLLDQTLHDVFDIRMFGSQILDGLFGQRCGRRQHELDRSQVVRGDERILDESNGDWRHEDE